MTTSGYDIIGDIHGDAAALLGMLKRLGYRNEMGCFRHPERTAVFLGDFIDHGRDSRTVLATVRPMVERGAALAVLGNHEFNAVCYHTPSKSGGYLRSREDPKNTAQHQATLDAFSPCFDELLEYIEWFKTLPLFLDLPGFRVVHAFWDDAAIARLRTARTLADLGPFNVDALASEAAKDMKLLCKGPERKIDGWVNLDSYGRNRNELRIAWWKSATNATCRQMAVKDEHKVPDIPFPRDWQPLFSGYSADAPLVFIGHYSLASRPAPLLPNLVNVDFGITAGRGVTAYRWNGEAVAHDDAFVQFGARLL